MAAKAQRPDWDWLPLLRTISWSLAQASRSFRSITGSPFPPSRLPVKTHRDDADARKRDATLMRRTRQEKNSFI